MDYNRLKSLAEGRPFTTHSLYLYNLEINYSNFNPFELCVCGIARCQLIAVYFQLEPPCKQHYDRYIGTCVLCQCTRYVFGVGFVGRGCVDYPDELESVLKDTATTGIVRYVSVSHTYH